MALDCISGGKCTGCMECEELEAVYYCDACGEEIYEGCTYYQVEDGHYCEYCVKRMEA